MRLYKTLIKDFVTYESETWILNEAIVAKFIIFESKILRRAFETNRVVDNNWRIEVNTEIYNENIINYTSLIICWLGHIVRMSNQGLD